MRCAIAALVVAAAATAAAACAHRPGAPSDRARAPTAAAGAPPAASAPSPAPVAPAPPACDAACADAAEAAFAAAETAGADLLALGPPVVASDSAALKSAIETWFAELNRRLDVAQRRYRAVLDVGSPAWSAAAACRLGSVYATVAARVRAFPAPAEVAYALGPNPAFVGVAPADLAAKLAEARVTDRVARVDPDGSLHLVHALTPEERGAYRASFVGMAGPFARNAGDTLDECVRLAAAPGARAEPSFCGVRPRGGDDVDSPMAPAPTGH